MPKKNQYENNILSISLIINNIMVTASEFSIFEKKKNTKSTSYDVEFDVNILQIQLFKRWGFIRNS